MVSVSFAGLSSNAEGHFELLLTSGTHGPTVAINHERRIHVARRLLTTGTARGNKYGDEYFGMFSRSIYSPFQLLTGESWSEVIFADASS